jgi:5-(hydroxymethyl)furfural/furfural oxidase
LIFEDQRCVGVVALVRGQEQRFMGREIILSCGAIHSPAHLLRSGIGPVGHLRDLGIPVRMALPGVGQGLMDHPSIALSSFLKRGARVDNQTRRHILLGLRYSSQMEGIPAGDMFAAVVSKSAWHAVGEQVASMLLWVNKTYSESGQLKLSSSNWRDKAAPAKASRPAASPQIGTTVFLMRFRKKDSPALLESSRQATPALRNAAHTSAFFNVSNGRTCIRPAGCSCNARGAAKPAAPSTPEPSGASPVARA